MERREREKAEEARLRERQAAQAAQYPPGPGAAVRPAGLRPAAEFGPPAGPPGPAAGGRRGEG